MKKMTRILTLLVCFTMTIVMVSCKPAPTGTSGNSSNNTSGVSVDESTPDNNGSSTDNNESSTDISQDESGTSVDSTGNSTDVLSGVSGTSSTSSQSKTSSVASSSEPQVDVSVYPTSLKGKTAKKLVWYTPNDNEKLVYANFTKVTGCNVKIVQTTYENYMVKLSGMIAANDAPDTANLSVRHYPTFMTKNLLQPIDKYIDKDDPLLDFSAMDLLKYDNSYYGIASSSTAETFVVYFNKTMFDNATNVNKNPLELYEDGQWNWDTFSDLVQKMVKKDNNGNVTRYGLSLERINLFSCSAGIDFITVSGSNITNKIKDPRILASWEYIKKLAFIDNYAIKISNPTNYMAQGKSAMAIEGSWAVDRGSANAPFKGMTDKWDWVPFPKYLGGTSYQPIESNVWGVPYRAKNPEAGYYLARWGIDPASLDGVEGAPDPHQYQTAADEVRLDELYAMKKYTTIAQGILGDQLWNLWWDLCNPDNQGATVIDSWVPKIDAAIERVVNEIPKK